MQWLKKVVDEAVAAQPDGEIIIESGISPSGTYHMGYLREIIICDAILQEIKTRGKKARHIHFVDDQDGFRKVPAGLPPEYEKYLGRPLFDMPAPEGSQSYADYSLQPFIRSVESLGIEMDIVRSHEKYRSGFFTPAIELALSHISETREILETVSGRKLGEEWSPIQVNEDGYLKKRPFVSLDTTSKHLRYLDKDGKERAVSYEHGQIKLDWRLDWPARWWRLGVSIEPFGRDHATKGGSYDTGKELIEKIFKAEAPLPVPYNFINRAGESKKMSASLGTGITVSEVVQILPPEVIRYFVLRTPPEKLISFDPAEGIVRLIDEFAELLAKNDKSQDDIKLIELSTGGIESTISNVPFSHLVASYQAALKDPEETVKIIKRTEHAELAAAQAKIIEKELAYIKEWLAKWAPDEVKFELRTKTAKTDFNDEQIKMFELLAAKIDTAPVDADGEWFHKAIYALKDEVGMEPKELFTALYTLLIGKSSGPRAGWFLSILPRDWLIKRLRLEG